MGVELISTILRDFEEVEKEGLVLGHKDFPGIRVQFSKLSPTGEVISISNGKVLGKVLGESVIILSEETAEDYCRGKLSPDEERFIKKVVKDNQCFNSQCFELGWQEVYNDRQLTKVEQEVLQQISQLIDKITN